MVQVFHSRLESTTGLNVFKNGPFFPMEFSADFVELEVLKPPSGWKLDFVSHPAVSQLLLLHAYITVLKLMVTAHAGVHIR